MEKIFIISVISENKPGVLYRISGIFLRRKINIEKLEVHPIDDNKNAVFTIDIKTNNDLVKKIANQIEKIIEVHEVFIK